MSLTGSIKISANATLSTDRDLGTATVTEAISEAISIANGSAANQATQVWGDTRTIGASGTEEIDLNGTLSNGIGETVSFTRVILVAILPASTNGDTITIGGAAANAWEPWAGASGDKVKLRPGGGIVLWATDATALAVTAGTADLLKIANDDGAASADYDILVIGSDA